ncbi:hypothetical protein [Labrys monachus]|uniref:Uncharacterized protein n=1 Tax=Labrys monachus TaxID=217067 RepID=A0ABU0FBH0_9HYPH|nr:hypothetical protein [Labrys monachus]MDQ0391667.1 hypothetical protein [Labrys monachus]
MTREDATDIAAPAAPVSEAPKQQASAIDGVEGVRDTVFDRLVREEEDIIGLLAFSLSMQNKRDWLAAFHQEVGRDPNSAELAAYDIGERIERRLATYRKLAENALSGNAFWASASLTPVSELPGAPMVEPTAGPSTTPVGRPSRFGGSAFAMLFGLVVIAAVAVVASRHYWGA